MAVIEPFHGLRFTSKGGKIETLVCPPYDIISEQERLAYLEENPHNIIRLELPKTGDNPYQAAGETLEEWVRDGIVAQDSLPALYLYEEEFTALGTRRKIKGLVCRVRLEEFDKGVVLPHEETLSKAKQDRFELMKATGCNFSSIYSLYFDQEREIYPYLNSLSQTQPCQEFSTRDGIVHRIWAVTQPEAQVKICSFMKNKTLYIADGHHRYETALNYRDYLRSQGLLSAADQTHGANYIMMTLVNMEHEGLVVYPTHRIVRDLPCFDLDSLLAGAGEFFQVDEITQDASLHLLNEKALSGQKAFVLCAKEQFYLLTLKDVSLMLQLLPNCSTAYRQLDVNILHTLLLERLLGIDKENMANQKNLIYTRDPDEAINQVKCGAANCAFLINATRVDEIAAVAGAGEKMPQKSTYFYPKLITGHIMNQF